MGAAPVGGAGRRGAGSGRAPHLLRRLDHQAQLGALGLHGDVVAVHGAAEAALRAQAQLVQRRVFGGFVDAALEQVWSAFHQRHREEYGHAFEASPIEIVTVKVRGIGEVEKLGQPAEHTGRDAPVEMSRGRCVFRVNDALHTFDTPYLDRSLLPVGAMFKGPAILLQTDTTTVVPPGWTYGADRFGNVRMTRDVI